jgi:para-aminobenzoate synthetase component 1
MAGVRAGKVLASPVRPLTEPRLRPLDLPLVPDEVARRLRPLPGFVWLDSAGPDLETGRALSILTAAPTGVIRGHVSELHELRIALAEFSSEPRADDGMPHGGLFGSVDFDGHFCFGQFPHALIFDHRSERWFERGQLSRHVAAAKPAPGALPPIDFRAVLNREHFLAMVRQALDYIAAGDIYQVNLSQPFISPWPDCADAFPFYERVRHFSPMPHGAFLDLGGRQVVSASPELFLRMSGRFIETRPIKGTRPRRRTAQDDERSAYDLITSRKEIAELVMITDLERNDLGRVCEFGSVTVPELLKLERFAQVFHLVSTVRGVLRGDVDHPAALEACFPGGSISGAPKIRALEIIAELESHPRGLYTGAIGYFGAGGESQFSIAIRTAVAEGGRLHFHAGAGIVADSEPAREYEETWDKASSLIGAAEWPRKFIEAGR